MDQELKSQWVKALRSGEYKQGKGRLGTRSLGEEKPKYCCLGVLCEVAKDRLSNFPMMWVGDDDLDVEILRVDGGSGYPSVRMIEVLGLPGTWGEFPEDTPYGLGDSSDNLANLNDDGFTFNQIADLIEWAF